ncbi:MAG: bifunctional chorismate mutase/prephenate dehydratase, partial [Chloroflexi bacterium]|nr:bifunctional chorismate mutase/prephenate dehydratase [Chloroflexota bacterium]
MVKLESRPMLGKPWEYMFYADIEADIEHESMASVLAQLKEKSENLRILGRY